MKQKKLPTNVKAIISLANGKRTEGTDITPDLLEFAINNRDQFQLVYTGDIFLPEEGAEVSPPVDEAPIFTPAQLAKMNKGGLLDICAKRQILPEGDLKNEEIVAMILADQNTAA